jgi:hypothetical protein
MLTGKRKNILLTLHPEILVADTDAEDLLKLRKAKRAEGRRRSIPLAEVKRKLRLR